MSVYQNFNSDEKQLTLFIQSVPFRKCGNLQCLRIENYDGSLKGILNMGEFLVGHDVLRDYLHHFISGDRFANKVFRNVMFSGSVYQLSGSSWKRYKYWIDSWIRGTCMLESSLSKSKIFFSKTHMIMYALPSYLEQMSPGDTPYFSIRVGPCLYFIS